jgi:hypothetical protein
MDVKACDIPEFWNCSNLYLHARSMSMREVGVVYSWKLGSTDRCCAVQGVR